METLSGNERARERANCGGDGNSQPNERTNEQMTKLTLACGMSLRSFSSAAGAHVLLHSSGRGVTARSYLSSVGRCVKKRSRTCIVGETISWRSTTCLNPRVVPVMNVSARASSTYENYDATSKTYDAARFAIAKPAVERTLKDVAVSLGVPVGELVTLDAGCGTGNYSVALAELGVGRVHALDGNSSMLAHLQAKIDRAAPDSPIARALHVVKDPVNLGARSVSLPLPDASIHCAVVSQVTHHLVRAELSNPFEPVEALVAELGRVVAPGGALIIQTSTPEQQRRGFWWADIVPVAAEKLSRRFSTVRGMLLSAFVWVCVQNCWQPIVQIMLFSKCG